jgi:hypothetical protein
VNTSRQSSRWSLCGECGLAAIAGVLVCLAGGAIAAAPLDAEREPAAPTAPATSMPVAQQIVPTAQEKAVLDAVQDRTERFDKDGLFAMLNLASRAPQLGLPQWSDQDRPAYANLVTNPVRYRATPLVMRVRVVLVTKLQSGAGLEFSPTWPADRPVWELDCVEADTPFQKDKPLRVYSLVDPAAYIGEPTEAGERGRRVYPTGPEVRIAALFYRLRHEPDSTAKLHDRPELVAWQISRALSSSTGEGGITTGLGKSTGVIVLAVATIGLYYITKRRAAKARQRDELPLPRRHGIHDEKEDDHGTNRPG